MKLGNISYRVKVPIVVSMIIILTACVVTVVLSWRVYEEIREELFHVTVEIGSVLSNSLPDAMLKDDLWSAYRLVRAAEGWENDAPERLLIVLDDDGRIYVSNRPKKLSPTSHLRTHGEELARLEAEILSNEKALLHPRTYEHPEDKRFYVFLPMISDGVSVGTIIVGYDKGLFWPKFMAIVKRVVFSVVLVMSALIPLGWFLGNRLVYPLSKLSYCMSRVGKEKPQAISCDLELGGDEIGSLGESFKTMLRQLDEKERMEMNMLASERLAAVGRLTAGVAHEINNPLGGMLNALSTFKRFSKTDELGRDTFMLIERGLKQIRDTVSALLVEANPKTHKLHPDDIEDVHTLLIPEINNKDITLRWDNGLDQTLGLPSTPIRQILMNLTLNAIHASYEGREVLCSVSYRKPVLRLVVENEGPEIPSDKIVHLFEPFVGDEQGNGLGLWVTYQLVLQLDGSIEVKSRNGKTTFDIEFVNKEVA